MVKEGREKENTDSGKKRAEGCRTTKKIKDEFAGEAKRRRIVFAGTKGSL